MTTPNQSPADAHRGARVGDGPYGSFSADGTEYCIRDPRTPRPWVNVISTPRLGLVVSQTGSGFTWIDNSQLAVITRWDQDFARDSSGKFIYIRDADTGDAWSLSPAPTWPAFDAYTCRHGLGYTTFVTSIHGIDAEWTLFCDPQGTAELWRIRLVNKSNRARRLDICAYLEWCCGVAPSPRREFHKLFIETAFDHQRGAVIASNHMWDVPNEASGHWNTTFPYVSAFAAVDSVSSAQGEKSAFFGPYCEPAAPRALGESDWQSCFGRHHDPVAALRSHITLAPGATHDTGHVLAVSTSTEALDATLEELRSVDAIDRAFDDARDNWRQRLAESRVDTPDCSLNHLANDWLRYQAISGRLWGRCGYYQQSGAFGFRDQLQDSQVWLDTDAAKCKEQILLHAAHQFDDGSVYHWWHPLTEQGLITRMTDDLLWLSFVTANYIKETGDLAILGEPAPFLDNSDPAPLMAHITRAFERVFQRSSSRGLPYIGAGDWNDGLSAAGTEERGESIWLGHFLAGLLADWAEIHRRCGRDEESAAFTKRHAELITAINAHGWDGDWYLRATLDDGTKLGSADADAGRIFLNAQTWAILNDVAPPDRAAQCMRAVKAHLVTEVGPLLLTPAFQVADPQVGYITRYAPGLRENGGVYTHAACWAIAAACKMCDHALVGELLDALNPTKRDSNRYWAEPYVTPGNIDGPESPYFGRGGWTWYTGSAAWLRRVVTHWVLGVRPEWDGLRIDPCLPRGWKRASISRRFRGSRFDIRIECDTDTPDSAPTVALDGATLPSNVVPHVEAGGRHHVTVHYR